jgi:VWFA-related protein
MSSLLSMVVRCLSVAVVVLAVQAQVFRSAVSYVEVDAVVTDRSGAFVRGLTKDDFEVRENGRLQDLSLVSLVDLPGDVPAASSWHASMPLPAGAPALSPEGRLYLIVLDTMHIDPSRTPVLRRQARAFVERYLGPHDRAAIAHIDYPGRSQEFTSDVALLVRSIDGAIGEKTGSATVNQANADPDLVESGVAPDREQRLRRHMAERFVFEVGELAKSLSAIERPRKALVLFSEGLDVDSGDIDEANLREEIQIMLTAAARANVTIYTIDPRGVPSIGDEMMQINGRSTLPSGRSPSPAIGLYRESAVAQGSLRNFAEETGGLAWVGSADLDRGFRAIVDDNSTYYLLGYYSGDPPHDGKFRKLSVSVKRRAVAVRARKGFYMK